MQILFYLLVFISLISFQLNAQIKIITPNKIFSSAFAIFVDNKTFEKTKEAILLYKQSIENEEISTFVLVNDWSNPFEIKKRLIELYNSKPKIIGSVFIGDIPIPMIRGAQHLTSAFKLDENLYAWHRSSVPSDRFYDDFDLKFDYLGKDTVNFLYHYFKLRSDSPQRIEKEIFTARIKPSPDDSTKYGKITRYLYKVVENKNRKNKLNNILIYTGHGYNSESLTAFHDETLILREHFPDAFKLGGRYKKLLFSMNREIKKVILSELERDELDLVVFHAHGTPDAQLITGYPLAKSIDQNIEYIKFYLRSKLRSANQEKKSVEQSKKYFKELFNVPDEWFEGAFDEDVKRKDSLLNSYLEISINDIRMINPHAEVVIFDECFNASFHLNEYVVGEYVFGNGNVIAGIGNSVNVLQDLFMLEFIGLLNYGISIGEWHKLNNYLESHIIGDPTFSFALDDQSDKKIIKTILDGKFQSKLLKSENPLIRSLAFYHFFKKEGDKSSNKLKEIYLNDPSPNVRLLALKCLAMLRDKNFEEVLRYSKKDPNEMIRRFSVQWMGFIGKVDFIPLIIEAASSDESDRVRYQARSVMELMNDDKMIYLIDSLIKDMADKKSKYNFDQNTFYLRTPDKKRQREIFNLVKSDTVTLRKKLIEVRTFRKYIYHDAIDELIKIAESKTMPLEIRSTVIEALGWYYFTPKRNQIISSLKKLLEFETDKSVKAEILMTINRLQTGPNNPFSP